MATTPPPQDQQQSFILYRLTSVEQKTHEIEQKFDRYATAKEQELQLKPTVDLVQRLQLDIANVKLQLQADIAGVKSEVQDISKQLDQQKETFDKFQIRILWGFVAFVLAIISAILIAYLTHTIVP